MGIGWIILTMAMSGFPMCLLIFRLMVLAVIGSMLMRDGLGFLIIHGDGHLFIMDDGFTILIMGGNGCRIMNGAPDGSPGEVQMITTVGLR